MNSAGFEQLRGHKYCALVSFRRSGAAVSTAVWFGLDGDGRLYTRTDAEAGKVKRIRANAHVQIAPSSARGTPTGPFVDGSARVLAAQDNGRAEAALQANYGLGRRLYKRLVSPLRASSVVYLEVTAGEPLAGAVAETSKLEVAADEPR